MEEVKKISNSVAILADGAFPTAEYPLSLLYKADKIICCDGSIVKLKKYTDLECYRIVGDMDTLSEENQALYRDLIIRISEQESNDLSKSFGVALSLNPDKIFILGATGAREDHTLGNISLLVDYAAEFGNVEMVTDSGRFIPFFDSFSLEASPGEQISIFCFDQSVRIKSEGLLYRTDNVIFDRWWKATLNKVVSSPFSLELSHPAPVLIFRCF